MQSKHWQYRSVLVVFSQRTMLVEEQPGQSVSKVHRLSDRHYLGRTVEEELAGAACVDPLVTAGERGDAGDPRLTLRALLHGLITSLRYITISPSPVNARAQ